MPSNDRSRLTPSRLAVREREQRCLELRMAGLPWDKVAEMAGYNAASSAYRAVERLLEERVKEPADKVREMEVMRLDRMIQALWPRALEGKWLAHDRILKIMERKAALMGLDAPQRRIVNVITDDVYSAALREREELLRELQRREQQGLEIDRDDITMIDAEVVAELEAGPSKESPEVKI